MMYVSRLQRTTMTRRRRRNGRTYVATIYFVIHGGTWTARMERLRERGRERRGEERERERRNYGLVCAPSLSSHRLEPNLCGTGSRGCAFESRMRHIHIFFFTTTNERAFDRSWNRMPDVARETTLLQRHGYDLGHERAEDVAVGIAKQRFARHNA